MDEIGESFASAKPPASTKPSDEIWAKLVQSNPRYSNIGIKSYECEICSEVLATSSDKHSWCKIVRNSDLCSATKENKSSNTLLVDGVELRNGDNIVIKDGSEIISGPDREGIYLPQVKMYEVRELGLKFERHLDSEIIDFQVWKPHFGY